MVRFVHGVTAEGVYIGWVKDFLAFSEAATPPPNNNDYKYCFNSSVWVELTIVEKLRKENFIIVNDLKHSALSVIKNPGLRVLLKEVISDFVILNNSYSKEKHFKQLIIEITLTIQTLVKSETYESGYLV